MQKKNQQSTTGHLPATQESGLTTAFSTTRGRIIVRTRLATPLTLLAALQRVEFPPEPQNDQQAFHRALDAARSNCRVITAFTQGRIAELHEDTEEAYCTYVLHREASKLYTAKGETVKARYDALADSVEYLFSLVDEELAPRVKAIM